MQDHDGKCMLREDVAILQSVIDNNNDATFRIITIPGLPTGFQSCEVSAVNAADSCFRKRVVINGMTDNTRAVLLERGILSALPKS